jgi:hypothetical protein
MTCKICGNPSDSEYCFQHKPRKKLSKGSPKFKKFTSFTGEKGADALKKAFKSTVKKRSISVEKADARRTMLLLFEKLWIWRGNKSEVSGTPIYGEMSSANFHHILPKSKYPEATLDEKNIIILTLDEHANVENDMYRYAKIDRIRVKLIKKYEKLSKLT